MRRIALEQHVRKALTKMPHKTYFSMIMPESGLQTLASIFQLKRWSTDGEVGFGGPKPDVMAVGSLEGQSDEAKKLVLFSVIDGQISRAKRTKVPGQTDLKGVASISIHELLEFSQETKTCVASVSPISTHVASEQGTELSMPMSLSICAIASTNLMSIYSWEEDKQQEDLVVRLSTAVRLDMSLAAVEPVLRLLLESAGGVAEGSPATNRVLRSLEEHGIVAGPSPFRLTPLGREMVSSGVALNAGSKICRRLSPTEGDYKTEATVYQLMLELDHMGWEHEVVESTWSRNNAKANPFLVNADVVDKVWYSKKKDAVCKFYLLALLCAKPNVVVPHFASSETYTILLGIPARTQKSKDTGHVDGHPSLPDDFDVTVKKQRKKRRVAEPVSSSDSGTEASVDTDTDSSSQASSNHSKSSQASSGGGDVAPDVAPDVGSDGNDGSDSSSDDSESSSDGPADSGQLLGAFYGIHMLTKRPNNSSGVGGWQLTCCADGHVQCSKTQSCTVARGGEDGALRRLKKWALLCCDAPGKDGHKHKWKQVEEAWADGSLESMEELDGLAPSSVRPQKKRRTT